MYFPKREGETWQEWRESNEFNNFHWHFCPSEISTDNTAFAPYPIMAERFGKMDIADGNLPEYHSEKYGKTTPREFYRDLKEVTDALGIDQADFRDRFDALPSATLTEQERVCREVWDIFQAMLDKGYVPYDLVS